MKQALRQSIIAARQKLTEADRFKMGQIITGHLIDLNEYKRAGVVLGYMSFGAEFATTPWVQHALLEGKQVFLPKVNKVTRQLDLYQVKDLQHDLQPGVWDIPEPVVDRCQPVEQLQEIDFILLPGVAFGRDGSRLGYGGGFYDKLLERVSLADSGGHAALVAAAFSMQIVEDIPQEATDRKVEWLITEEAVIKCSEAGNDSLNT